MAITEIFVAFPTGTILLSKRSENAAPRQKGGVLLTGLLEWPGHTTREAVDVTGTPCLKIKMDPNYGEKWANYESGSGTTSLTFTHEVVQLNESTQGIAVPEDTLELNVGTIKSTATIDVESPQQQPARFNVTGTRRSNLRASWRDPDGPVITYGLT